jgi:hypothetical protein
MLPFHKLLQEIVMKQVDVIKSTIAANNRLIWKTIETNNTLIEQHISQSCDTLRASILQVIPESGFSACVDVIRMLLTRLRGLEFNYNTLPVIVCIKTGESSIDSMAFDYFRTAFPHMANFSMHDKHIVELISYAYLTDPDIKDLLTEDDDIDVDMDGAVKEIESIVSGYELDNPIHSDEDDDEEEDDDDDSDEDEVDDDCSDSPFNLISRYALSELVSHLKDHRILLAHDFYDNHYEWNFVIIRDNIPVSVLEYIPVSVEV